VGSTWRTVLMSASVLAAAAAPVLAQDRAGLMGGISFGGGTVHVRGTSDDPALAIVRRAGNRQADFALNMYIGGRMRRDLSLVLEIAFASAGTPSTSGEVRLGANRATFTASAASQTSNVFAGGLQYWVAERVWLRGGIGIGSMDTTLLLDDAGLTITLDRGTGAAVLAAAGVDVWRRGNFAVDVQVHLTSLSLANVWITSPSAHVGFTWH
jgi:hypothetical protein